MNSKKYTVTMLAILVWLVAACVEPEPMSSGTSERTIALTFDDATRGDGPFFSGSERTDKLIQALAQAGVAEAMFFVTTRNVANAGESGPARLGAYTDAGHVLGNHSHSHQWLWRTDTDAYIADVDKAIAFLADFDNVQPYYRFPYLDEGRDVGKRDALREVLESRGLKNGYVTIDTYDWHLVSLAKEARLAGAEMDLDDLRDLYVDVISRSVEFYDSMAQQTLGRSPHHVLLLHENDLAALFIGDLVEELRERGFRVVPSTVAFDDPIAGREPETLFLGQGRVAALAHEAGWVPQDLVSPTEDEAYLRNRFEAEVVALPAP